MRLNTNCMCCQIRKQEAKIRQFSDEDKKVTYLKAVLNRFANAGPDDCAPNISTELKKYFAEYWGVPMEDFTETNKEFNTLMMSLEADIRKKIFACEDPLATALVYARIGNYIDFAALPNVDKDALLALIGDADKDSLDETEYAFFKEDLAKAKHLVYLTDNCGEVVLDKIAVEILKEQYPDMEITVIVRGLPAANDATLADAEMCGLTKVTTVVGNGSDITGTWLPGVNEETHRLLDQADVIISKGQANYETLHESGLNIYYLFLCKCAWFVKMFNTELFSGMFVNEKRTPDRQ